MVQMVEETDHL